jgi:nucleoside-diphosphate-sugar epimerase
MKYTVLGSDGLIGSHLTRFLRAQGHEVVEFDIAVAPYQDLRIDYAVDSYINESDFVFFMAFDVGGATYLKSYQHTFDFVDNNTRLMTNTFRALKDLRKPFIFASSEMANLSFSSYGALKLVGEHYCKVLDSPVVKFWNIYGIEKNHSKTHVITDFVRMALNKNPITMKTDGTEERQFLYADDCAEAIYKMSLQYDKLSRLSEYHIASFDWTSIKNVASIVSELCDGATIIPSREQDLTHRSQRHDPSRFILTEGLWKPTTSLRLGIAKIVEHERQLM